MSDPTGEFELLTVRQLANKAGWPPGRMLRHLKTMDAQSGGMLLKNVSRGSKPHFVVCRQSLKRLAPQWFADEESQGAQLQDLKDMVRELREENETMMRHIGRLTRQLARVTDCVRVLEGKKPVPRALVSVGG